MTRLLAGPDRQAALAAQIAADYATRHALAIAIAEWVRQAGRTVTTADLAAAFGEVNPAP